MQNYIREDILDEISTHLLSDGIQKVVVGAVIVVEPLTPLLLQRTADDFMGGFVELPSGTVDLGESFLDALVREIREETGLTISSVDEFLGAFDYASGSGKKTRQLNFKVTTTHHNVVLSAEHEAFFTPEINTQQFETLNISTQTRSVILRAFGVEPI